MVEIEEMQSQGTEIVEIKELFNQIRSNQGLSASDAQRFCDRFYAAVIALPRDTKTTAAYVRICHLLTVAESALLAQAESMGKQSQGASIRSMFKDARHHLKSHEDNWAKFDSPPTAEGQAVEVIRRATTALEAEAFQNIESLREKSPIKRITLETTLSDAAMQSNSKSAAKGLFPSGIATCLANYVRFGGERSDGFTEQEAAHRARRERAIADEANKQGADDEQADEQYGDDFESGSGYADDDSDSEGQLRSAYDDLQNETELAAEQLDPNASMSLLTIKDSTDASNGDTALAPRYQIEEQDENVTYAELCAIVGVQVNEGDDLKNIKRLFTILQVPIAVPSYNPETNGADVHLIPNMTAIMESSGRYSDVKKKTELSAELRLATLVQVGRKALMAVIFSVIHDRLGIKVVKQTGSTGRANHDENLRHAVELFAYQIKSQHLMPEASNKGVIQHLKLGWQQANALFARQTQNADMFAEAGRKAALFRPLAGIPTCTSMAGYNEPCLTGHPGILKKMCQRSRVFCADYDLQAAVALAADESHTQLSLKLLHKANDALKEIVVESFPPETGLADEYRLEPTYPIVEARKLFTYLNSILLPEHRLDVEGFGVTTPVPAIQEATVAEGHGAFSKRLRKFADDIPGLATAEGFSKMTLGHSSASKAMDIAEAVTELRNLASRVSTQRTQHLLKDGKPHTCIHKVTDH